MVKVWTVILFLSPLPSFANLEEVKPYEVRKLAQKANQEAQQKAARQKSEPDEMLKLLSTFETGPTGLPEAEQGDTIDSAEPPFGVVDESSPVSTVTNGAAIHDESIAPTTRHAPELTTALPRSSDSVSVPSPPPSGMGRSKQQNLDVSEAASRASDRKASELADTDSSETTSSGPKAQAMEHSPEAREKPLPPSVYLPSPGITASRGSAGRYGAVVRSNEYGILFGRWVRARIEREVNSGDSGEIEIILEDDLAGKYRTIPAGTIIYASKGLNRQTQRLAIQTRRAVTPDNQVIPTILASAYDNTRRAGLSGFVERNREEVYQDAAGKALIELANSAVSAALPSELGSVTDVVADLESPQGNAIPYTIKVQPQSFWLRIDESL